MKKYIRTVAVIMTLLALSRCHHDPVDTRSTVSGSTSDSGSTSVPVIRSGWVTENGLTFYYQPDGTYVTGMVTIDDSIYYFDGDGILQHGWISLQEGSYYCDENGILATGWLDLDGHRYYMGEDGMMRTGWQIVDGARYYFLENGAMARGQIEIAGIRYFFTSTGTQIAVVNPWNAVADDYDPDLVDLDIYYGKSGSQVSAVCLDSLKQMIDDCNNQCTRVYVVSSYRTYDYQAGLFENRIRRFQNEGYSRSEAETLAATVVARPGTSEHHLGLAVDIVDNHNWSLTDEQADMPGQKWLMEHCWEYGFILRYPKDSTDSTGIIWEPWHYRYVGKELAQELHECGLTLEQYLESLSA